MEPINIVTIGHIDHGKSTLIGRMLYDSGAVKPERIAEAKETAENLGRDDIDFAFLMDTFKEEREDGITIDIMHTPFKGNKKEFMFIDCPGHREFIKNMITGASHADAALLLVSAKRGEGVQNQTKEHTWLAKILGINQIVVVVNKMDTVDYAEGPYREIKDKVEGLLENMGFDKDSVPFIPVSALEGENVFKKSGTMRWYSGDSLIDVLDNNINQSTPPADMPLRVVIQDVYDVEGEEIVIGRVETGILKVGDDLVFLPSDLEYELESIKRMGKEVESAKVGESVGMVLSKRSCDISRGDVACHKTNPINSTKKFRAQIYIMEPFEVTVGDYVNVRCGTASAKCRIERIVNLLDPRSGESLGKYSSVSVGQAAIIELSSDKPLALEKNSDIPQLGRFVILDDGITKAYGIVLELVSDSS